MRHEIVRKAVHCFGCVAAMAAAMLPLWVVIVVSFVVVSVYLAAEALRVRGRKLPPITTLTDLCSRPQERDHPAFGPVALAFGFVCVFLLFRPEVACAGFVVSCVADSAAALVGKAVGRHRIPYSRRKTVEGFAAGCVCALPVGLLCVGPLRGAIAAAAAAAIESLPLGDLDNLLLPVATGCLLAVLGR